jgi:hypothetical protein
MDRSTDKNFFKYFFQKNKKNEKLVLARCVDERLVLCLFGYFEKIAMGVMGGDVR